MYEIDKDKEVKCPDMKGKWLQYLMSNPYITTRCEQVDPVGCVKSADLTRLFSASFELIKQILLKFGFRVTIGQLGYNRKLLSIYKNVYSDFNFIISAVEQIEKLITSENEIDHDLLVKTSDIRPAHKCKNILDIQKVCGSMKKEKACLNEDEARGLLNYILLYYMIDNKKIIPQDVMKG